MGQTTTGSLPLGRRVEERMALQLPKQDLVGCYQAQLPPWSLPQLQHIPNVGFQFLYGTSASYTFMEDGGVHFDKSTFDPPLPPMDLKFRKAGDMAMTLVMGLKSMDRTQQFIHNMTQSSRTRSRKGLLKLLRLGGCITFHIMQSSGETRTKLS